MKEPFISVGIMSAPQIGFTLPIPYRMWGSYSGGAITYSRVTQGEQTVTFENGGIRWEERTYDLLQFEPLEPEKGAAELKKVTIGRAFHWERQESQRFPGILRFIVEDGQVTAINLVPAETYLTCVISSEMSAHASPELLKAHAVISRSWLLAALQRRAERGEAGIEQDSPDVSHDRRLKWYERDEHQHFDVCADDHCQRYQGLDRSTTETVRLAVAKTRGQVLMQEEKICDTRFSKCCGGALEEFQYCWADTPYRYLSRKRDWMTGELPDLTREEEAERWIRSTPDAFCHTTNPAVLKQVLNDYDQETNDFYRWRVEYDAQALSQLVKERSGIDYGRIIDLIPMARGTSGRLWQLKIVGTRQTLIIGKELEIRRTLSPTHLYSSAFVVDKEGTDINGYPLRFILTGAGWGHGVGLCQIGAAMMSEQGYKYDEILHHYYKDTALKSLYP